MNAPLESLTEVETEKDGGWGEGKKQRLLSSLAPSHIVFFFVLASRPLSGGSKRTQRLTLAQKYVCRQFTCGKSAKKKYLFTYLPTTEQSKKIVTCTRIYNRARTVHWTQFTKYGRCPQGTGKGETSVCWEVCARKFYRREKSWNVL